MAAAETLLAALGVVLTSAAVALLAAHMYLRRVGDGTWGWLEREGVVKRFMHLIVPQPPANIFKVVHIDNTVELHYNVDVIQEKDGVVIRAPSGLYRGLQLQGVPVGLNVAVYGVTSPLHVTAGSLLGIGLGYITAYMMSLAIYGVGIHLALIMAFAFFHVLTWFRYAMTPNTMLYSGMVLAMGPREHVIAPLPGETGSPLQLLRLLNVPVVIRIDRSARDVLYEVAELIRGTGEGGPSPLTTSAILLTLAARYKGLQDELKARDLMDWRSEAERRSSLRRLRDEIVKQLAATTLAKVIIYAAFFLLGAAFGAAVFGGTDVVVTPAG